MSTTKLDSLQELRSVVLVAPPEPPEIDLSRPPEEIEAQMKARGEEIRKQAKKTKESVVAALSKLQIRERLTTLEERESFSEEAQEAQEYITKILNYQVPAYQRAAKLGVLIYKFSQPLRAWQELANLLEWLVKEGVVEEESNGFLKVFKKTYALSPTSLLQGLDRNKDTELAEWLDEIEKALKELKSRVWEETKKGQENRAKQLLARGELSYKDVQRGKAGTWSALVPDDIGQRNGEPIILRGGVIHSQCSRADNGSETAVFPLESAAYFKVSPVEVGEGRYKRAVGIMTKSLTAEKPVFTEFISDKDQLKQMYFAWSLLRRAARFAEEAERMAPTKKELAAQASSSMEKWLLEGTREVCLAEYPETWEVRNPQGETTSLIHHLFFLVGREEENGEDKIFLVEVPDHLKELLASCMGKYPEGEKFSGCPQPLQMILRGIYGKALEASQDAKKAAQINGNGR